jgi:hypothetical protein
MQPNCVTAEQLTDANILAANVLRDGWVKPSVSGIGQDLRLVAQKFADQLGAPVTGRAGRAIEPLVPTQPMQANAKSLSRVHGLGAFPMHTDGAHRVTPPRFVVLVCASPGTTPVPTVLLRFSDLEFSGSERARFEAAPFLVRNGRRSFYSTICSTSRPFVRFDEECMVPQDASGKTSARLIAQRAKDVGFTSVHWRAGEVLLIDNWNVLHGRGLATPVASSDRKLFRVSVQ